MKTVLTPQVPEKAEYFSDFSGKKFAHQIPAVQVKMEFNYGSEFDGARFSIDLSDAEAEEILSLIRKKLSPKSRKNIKRMLASSEKDYQDHMDSRDWGGCELCFGEMKLLKKMLSHTR